MEGFPGCGPPAFAIAKDGEGGANVRPEGRSHQAGGTPDGSDSPAASWIQRIQAGPYHTCYEVDDLEAVMAFLRCQRLFPVLGPLPAVAFNKRRVVFLWSDRSGLIELLEADNV